MLLKFWLALSAFIIPAAAQRLAVVPAPFSYPAALIGSGGANQGKLIGVPGRVIFLDPHAPGSALHIRRTDVLSIAQEPRALILDIAEAFPGSPTNLVIRVEAPDLTPLLRWLEASPATSP